MSTKHSISALVFLFAAACSSDDPSTNITPGGSSDGDDAQDGSSDGESDGSDQGDGEEQQPGDGDDGEEPDECGTVLHATVRDFRFEHPDFENDGFLADFAYPGLV